MRDPFSWSFPIGRVFGITVRVHFFMPIVMLGLIGRIAYDNGFQGSWIDGAWFIGLLFLSVLLHEFGHCFAAYRVGGEAHEVILWPLGGLARCDVPHNPLAHFIQSAGGPAVNILLCLLAAGVLAFAGPGYQPPWNLFVEYPFRLNNSGEVLLHDWHGAKANVNALVVLVPWWLFYVNFSLALLNLLLVGLPFDAGHMLRAALWPRFGYRQATLWAVFAGFGIMFLLLAISIFKNEVLLILLAWYTYASCKQEWILLETGGEDSVFGYDFSQGYTSLEREEDNSARPRRKRQNFFQRWLQRRKATKMHAQQQRQDEEDRRMDELLEKIQRYGKASLSDEEQRFLRRVSDRFRNKPT